MYSTYFLRWITKSSQCDKLRLSVFFGQNYQQAFDLAIAELSKNKTKSSSQKNIPILKEAYEKALLKDNGINFSALEISVFEKQTTNELYHTICKG